MQQLQQGQQALGGNFSGSAVNVDPTTGQQFFTQAAEGVGAFSPAGLQAQGLQSALSGAQGQAAFDEALLNSPAQAFFTPTRRARHYQSSGGSWWFRWR